jgi:hypothetical protein
VMSGTAAGGLHALERIRRVWRERAPGGQAGRRDRVRAPSPPPASQRPNEGRSVSPTTVRTKRTTARNHAGSKTKRR